MKYQHLVFVYIGHWEGGENTLILGSFEVGGGIFPSFFFPRECDDVMEKRRMRSWFICCSTLELCTSEQVTSPLWASVSSSEKQGNQKLGM